jgi:hypothetical protein
MHYSKLYFCLASAFSLALPSLSSAAVITWDGSGDGTNWLDGSNWDTDSVPGSVDSVHLGGNAVQVNGPGATYAAAASGSAGTIDINSGGVLTQVGNSFNALRFFTKVNVNDGGTFVADPVANIRTNLDILAGGTLEGTSRIRDAKTLNVGGIFRPENDAAESAYLVNDGGSVLLGSTGTIELGLFGNMNNVGFLLNAGANTVGATLDLSAGSVELVLQGGYTPIVGDSFDLWDVTNVNSIVTPGTGNNIFLDGYDLDFTQWATDGVVSISAVSAVPEPSTWAALLGGIGMITVIARRRLRRPAA